MRKKNRKMPHRNETMARQKIQIPQPHMNMSIQKQNRKQKIRHI
jgi:hypothetical protein